MLDVVICDDDENSAKLLEQETGEFYREQGISCRIKVYCSGKMLLYDSEEGARFDLVLLDIELEDANGLEVAEKLKKLMDPLIIFVTAYSRYVYDAFKLQPFRYIPKPQLKERLREALFSAARRIQESRSCQLILKTGQALERIIVNRIVCAEREGNYVVIYSDDGQVYRTRGSLKQFLEELRQTGSSESFVLVGQCICSLSKVEKIEGNTVYLNTGKQLYIAKGKVRELKEAVLDYWISESPRYERK